MFRPMIAVLRSLGWFKASHLHLYQGVASLALLRTVQFSAGLVATYFLARSMSKDAFGEYNMVFNVIGLLTIFSLSGLNNSIVQAVARGYFGTYRAIVPIAFLSSCCGGAILLALSGWYYFSGYLPLAAGLLVSAFLFPFTHGLLQWKGVITGNAKFGRLLLHDGLVSLTTHGLIIVAAIWCPGQYVLAIIASLLVPGVYNVALTVASYQQIPFDAPVEPHNVRYGIETTIFSSLGAIGANLDRLLLFFFLSPIALAVFVAAARIPELLSGGMQDVSAVLAPRLAKYQYYTKRLDRIFRLLSVAYGSGVVLLAFAIVPSLVVFIFGDAYADAVPYAQALTCSVAIGFLANLRFRYIRSRIDARSFRDITLLSSAVRLVAFMILVPPLGLWGAVIGIFIYRITLAGVVRGAIKRHYPALSGAN